MRGSALQRRASQPRAARSMVRVSALFGRKAAVVEAPPPPPAKKGWFGRKAAVVEEPPAPPAKRGLFGGRSSGSVREQQTVARTPAKRQKIATTTSGKAAAKPAAKAAAKEPVDKAAEYERRQSGFGKIISALDFAEVRSTSDAELLYDAKYGKMSGGKLTPEQAAALRRRVVGTKADFWKGYVEVKGEYADKGWVSKEGTASSVPALPFLVAVVLGMLGATAVVVSQTS